MSKRNLMWGSLLLVIFLTTSLPPATFAAERSPNQIAVTYVAISGSYGALWAAKDEGLFKKNGLDVTLQYLNPTAGLFMPKDFIDNEIIQQLSSTGFFK